MKNIPVIGKFLSIMAVFGIFTILAAGYSSLQIKHTDTAYSELLDGPASAATYLSRAARTLQTARAAIGDLLIADTEEGNKAAAAEVATAREAFAKYMDGAVKALTDDGEALKLRQDATQLLDTTCAGTIKAGLNSKTAQDNIAAAALHLKECQPGFVAMTPRFIDLVTKLNESIDAQNEALGDESDTSAIVTLASVVGGLAIILTLAFFAIRVWVSAPINTLSQTMRRLADGDLSAEVDGAERRDEIGGMAKAVQVFKDNGLSAVELAKTAERTRVSSESERVRNAETERERADKMAQATASLAEGLKRLSSGDLTYELTQPFAADFEGLRTDFNGAVAQLRQTLQEVGDATSSIDGGTREMSGSAGDLSKRTEQQAASLEETAAALDQITANVKNSSQRTESARAVAIEANQSARQSGEVVNNAVAAMGRIEQSSGEISNIIGVIDEIAFQTNLLALNAGVEAARAGEAGKGFAVVAQEVRELAQRSAKAAKEIKDLISTSAREVETGVKLVSATGEALKVIEHHVVEINTELDAIATSAHEQSSALAEVNSAVNHMDQATQKNAAMVEEATAATATLAEETDRLRRLLSRFTIGDRAPQAHQARRAATTSQPAQPQWQPRAVAPAPRPQLARTDRVSPVSSPARQLLKRVAGAVDAKASAGGDWEEF